MTQMLYRDREGRAVIILDRHVQRPLSGDVWLVLFEWIAPFDSDDPDQKYVMVSADFYTQFKKVEFDCGVDLYAILHQVLDKETAYEIANRIEKELAKKSGVV